MGTTSRHAEGVVPYETSKIVRIFIVYICGSRGAHAKEAWGTKTEYYCVVFMKFFHNFFRVLKYILKYYGLHVAFARH